MSFHWPKRRRRYIPPADPIRVELAIIDMGPPPPLPPRPEALTCAACHCIAHFSAGEAPPSVCPACKKPYPETPQDAHPDQPAGLA